MPGGVREWWKLEGGVISGWPETHPAGGGNRGDHAMTMSTDTATPALLLGEAGSDAIEDRLRETVRATIEALFDEAGRTTGRGWRPAEGHAELAAFLAPSATAVGAARGRAIATGDASAS